MPHEPASASLPGSSGLAAPVVVTREGDPAAGGDGVAAVAAEGAGGAGEARRGGGADQAPETARGALGLRLLRAPEGLPQLLPRHPAVRRRPPQCRQ